MQRCVVAEDVIRKKMGELIIRIGAKEGGIDYAVMVQEVFEEILREQIWVSQED